MINGVLEKMEVESLTQEEIQELGDRGYEILHKLGEGQTREAYLAKYVSGEVNKLRVVKIPKTEISPDSICTMINRSKRDLDSAEVSISNEIQHPNVVEVVDNFRLDGKTVNIEAYYEGEDLESRIKSMGPIQDDRKFNNIFNQVIDALVYLNQHRGILHRDIKPSNIIVTRNGVVKLSDLQNAAKRYDIHDVSMPTRGGTPYTHPNLLNALILGRNASANDRTEIYALGGTMLYALTGENPFAYNISSDPNGKPIQIEGKVYKIKLNSDGTNLEEITERTHEANLKKALKNVPKKYKDLVNRCLTLNDKKAFKEIHQVEKAFEKISSGFYNRIKEGIIKSARYILPTAGAAALISLGIWGASLNSGKEPRPTLRDMLRNEDYTKFSLGTLEGVDKDYALDILVPYMNKARKQLAEIKDERVLKRINHSISHARNVHRMPERLTSAWLKACYINQKAEKNYEREGEERISPSFVPFQFVRINDTFGHGRGLNDLSTTAHGVMYLKQCFGPGKNVADVFAQYFSSNEDINTARVRTKSVNYLPRIKAIDFETDKTGKMGVGTLEIGYSQMLPHHERELINTALALYMITNEQGNIDFNDMPKLRFFPGKYKEHLRLPQ